ncbi:uncharacterized protein EV420DRAFT_1639134 [Desarmillaria tabescens]|uniref:Uncharacterized protein n=1 Tax=Armillaria tabescens TaxID=1929756 RepID=A0AA39NCM5_ARMTA|nr:uncharacterized protein EV420DRAFT_1639134 [Desarmillaria tabescens]KAK0463043.1 hypothetical protein EV420DRAFT_1639134 [Desarmillaria tabescens]
MKTRVNLPILIDLPIFPPLGTWSDFSPESEEAVSFSENNFERFWEGRIRMTVEDQNIPQDDRPPSPHIPSDQSQLPANYIRTKYHPSSGREPREESLEAFQVQEQSSEENIPVDDTLWCPYRSLLDFELSECILEAALNEGDTDSLLKNIAKQAYLRTPLKGEDYRFDVYHRDLWSWTLDILQDPVLVPHLVWDAQKLFRHQGRTSERFYTEPWTGNIFWEVQSALPNDGKPICYIIYADKTHLSSFGTVQGYPVIVRLGNLPAHICNGQGIGGGRVIGWLPIVQEEPRHHNKPYYADFKRTVWHKAFEIILSSIKDRSKLGTWVQPSSLDATPWHVFPTIMILSADYEEHQRKMDKAYRLRTAAWSQGLYNEARELTSASDRNALLQPYGLRFVENVFWSIEHCDVHRALSFDHLHAFHNGLFGNHLRKEVIARIEKLGSSFSQQADNQSETFPSWKDLYHFKQGFMNVTFTDGQKYEALSKQLIFIAHNILTQERDPIGYLLLRALRVYMELDMYAGLSLHTSGTLQAGRTKPLIFAALIDVYLSLDFLIFDSSDADKQPSKKTFKTWEFPKIHSHKHLFNDIEAKGVTLNYNTKPNESMHGSFKEAYQRCTNFKDFEKQILRIDLHDRQAGQAQSAEAEAEEGDPSLTDEEEAVGQPDYTTAASVHGHHGKGGGKMTIAEVEGRATDNRNYRDFQERLSAHMQNHFKDNPEDLPLVDGTAAAFEGFSPEDLV